MDCIQHYNGTKYILAFANGEKKSIGCYDVELMKEAITNGISTADIAKAFDIPESAVKRILKREKL